ncbi:MAG TPA: recombinase family protein [Candidatus Angelobacter sp.]|nr:recombinase family protein [Candidatus Angelobacter sp.]
MVSRKSTTSGQRVALYARVSTSDKGQDPEMQLAELREYCERREWTIRREYVDSGISGAKESRPELNRLMADAYRREFDTVLVWKVDRFGRSLKGLVTSLADLHALGVAFVSLKDNLDLTTPTGRLTFQIIGALAEFERAMIAERVRSGLRHARTKGKRLGRPTRDVDAAKVIEMRRKGKSWRAIAEELGAGVGTVYRAGNAGATDDPESLPESA